MYVCMAKVPQNYVYISIFNFNISSNKHMVNIGIVQKAKRKDRDDFVNVMQ
jgi:hypothetical protein